MADITFGVGFMYLNRRCGNFINAAVLRWRTGDSIEFLLQNKQTRGIATVYFYLKILKFCKLMIIYYSKLDLKHIASRWVKIYDS